MDKYQSLFVLGNPRSGTSLFRLMLTSHPAICVPPECGYIQWWFTTYKDWSEDDSVSLSKVRDYVKDVSISKKIETWNLDYHGLTELILKLKPKSYAELSLCAIIQYAKQTGKAPVYLGDKNNYYINHLDLLATVFPKAKYLIITRDGRDVACSYQALATIKSDSPYKPKLSTDINIIANEWASSNENLFLFRKKVGDQGAMMVRFEDLVLKAEFVLRQVCAFLDISYNDSMMHYHTQNKQFELEPAQLIEWKAKTLEVPDKSNIYKYKNLLSAADTAVFNAVAGSTLSKLGYEL